jgi:hypothetical protein
LGGSTLSAKREPVIKETRSEMNVVLNIVFMSNKYSIEVDRYSATNFKPF